MKDSWIQTFLLWTETEEYQKRIADAYNNIISAIARHKKAYVSVSGGKDSTVLMDLCLRADPDMLVFHWNMGRWLVPEPIENEIQQHIRDAARNVLIETSPLYEKYQRSLPVHAYNRKLYGKIEPELIRKGYDLCFLGLRAQESCRRKQRTKDGGDRPGKIDTAHPLRDLDWRDIWGYIISHKLPYLDWYDRQEDVDIGYDRSRLGTFYIDAVGSQNVDAVLLPEFMNQYI